MFPPSQGMIELNFEATSGISGSISIACWVVVFSPQIIENFRRHSADGLSVVFLLIWLLGDIFNVVGAILQAVLPTMIILAVYYTFADSVLVCQVFYYRGFTMSDEVKGTEEEEEESTSSRRAPLLSRDSHADNVQSDPVGDPSPRVTYSQRAWTSYSSEIPQRAWVAESRRMSLADTRRSISFANDGRRVPQNNARRRMTLADIGRQMSFAELGQAVANLDSVRLLPTAPLANVRKDDGSAIQSTSGLKTVFVNSASILMVCGAGITGWWIGQQSGAGRHLGPLSPPAYPEFHPLGQIFGYLCTVFYLGSRVPQLLLNFRRKSTEGVSLLFFLFACIGNFAYCTSIFAYTPICKHPNHCLEGELNAIYGRYVLVNLSWILGSAGTLLLDMAIFWQFFLYKKSQSRVVEVGDG